MGVPEEARKSQKLNLCCKRLTARYLTPGCSGGSQFWNAPFTIFVPAPEFFSHGWKSPCPGGPKPFFNCGILRALWNLIPAVNRRGENIVNYFLKHVKTRGGCSMRTRVMAGLGVFILMTGSRLGAQEVTFCEPYSDRFTVNEELVAKIGNYFWVEMTSRQRPTRHSADPGEDR